MGPTAAALVVVEAVAVAELTTEDASDATEPAWLVIALSALAASEVMLPRMLFALEVRDEREAAAPVFVAASELRREIVAEKADLAELKLAAIDCSTFSAEFEAEAATEAADLETEAIDSDMSDETEDRELETAAGGRGVELVGPAVLLCANTDTAVKDASRRLYSSMVKWLGQKVFNDAINSNVFKLCEKKTSRSRAQELSEVTIGARHT